MSPKAASRAPEGGEAGFTLVMLMAGVAVMMIMMAVGAPTWRYVMQNDREQELFFRGNQIAQAIEEFQRKNGGVYPPSLQVLVDRRFLRKLYKDPMTKSGEWRLIRQGEALPGAPLPGGFGGTPPSPRPSTPAGQAGEPGRRLGGGGGIGVVAGVVSTSTESSLRLYNGRSRYDQWTFLAGQPRRMGRDSLQPILPVPGVPGLANPGIPGQNPPGATPGSNPRVNPLQPPSPNNP